MLSFLDLPGEIRSIIYSNSLIDPRSSREIREDETQFNSRRTYLYPALLQTCRRVYEEAVIYLYAENEFLVDIHPDLGWHAPFQKIHLPPMSSKYFKSIKTLDLRICLGDDPLATDSDLKNTQKHLREFVIGLLTTNIQLPPMRIFLQCAGLHLSHNQRLYQDVLRPLKEVRVRGSFEIIGADFPTNNKTTLQYISDVRSIVLGKGLPEEKIGPVSSRKWEMYQDLMDTVRGFHAALMQIDIHARSVNQEEFQQKLNCVSDILELRHEPDLRQDLERLEKIDMEGALCKLEELYQSVPRYEGWGTNDESEFSEVFTEHMHTLFVRELDFLRDWLFLRPEFHDMEIEGAPTVRTWEKVIHKSEHPPDLSPWGCVEA